MPQDVKREPSPASTSQGVGRRQSDRRDRRTAHGGRRIVAAVLSLLAVVLAVATTWPSRAPRPPRGRPTPAFGALDVRAAGALLGRIDVVRYVRGGRLDRTALAGAVGRVVPARSAVQRGAARIAYRYDVADALSQARRITPSSRMIDVGARALSVNVSARVVRQALRNDCEATALQVLLGTVRIHVDQLRLQAELPRSGPLDPVGRGPIRVWGDPERGFVGRSDGGGTAGGFGVYQRPIRALARTQGYPLGDLTRRGPQAIYRRLLEGHAVMAWVGLSEGPYGHWRSPEARPVRVNFGEHTVVLTGLTHDGRLIVVNPLQGTREIWTKADFVMRWRLLGQRALST